MTFEEKMGRRKMIYHGGDIFGNTDDDRIYLDDDNPIFPDED